MKRISLFCLLVWVLPAFSRPVLAVLDVQSTGFADGQVAKALQESLAKDASLWEQLQVLDMEKYRKLALEEGLLIPAQCDAACYAEVGEKIDADLLIQAKARKVEQGVELELYLYDTDSETLVRSVSIPAGTSVGYMVQYGLQDLLGKADVVMHQSSGTQDYLAMGLGAAMAAMAAVLWFTGDDGNSGPASNYYQLTSPVATNGP